MSATESSWSDQARRRTSYSNEEDALAWSCTATPVSQPRRYPATGGIMAAARYVCGSASRSHMIFGPQCDASAFRPLIWKIVSAGNLSVSSRACRTARRSSQMMPLRSASRLRSTGTTPSTWQARPRWLTSDGPIPASSMTARAVAAIPSRHCPGSCSDQPLRGWIIEHGCDAVARVLPSGAQRTAFTLCDPTSTPITCPTA